MKYTVFTLFTLLLLASCQKQPTAKFNTDKTLYYAGETIHLTDASSYAHHWLWTLPDRSKSIEQSVDFLIDTNIIGGTYKVTLEVTSINSNKKSSYNKDISISQKISSSDFIEFSDSTKNWKFDFLPTEKYVEYKNNNWYIYLKKSEVGICLYDDCYFKIPNTPSQISNSIDSFQSNRTSFYYRACIGDAGGTLSSLSGIVTFTKNNHSVNLKFQNCNATDGTSQIKAFGNLSINF